MANTKIERKYMAHYLDTSFGGDTASWYRIGEDLEEYNVEMNPDTEVKKNILGNSTFIHNGYEPSADSDPFYARVGDALFEQLQTIVDTQATYDGLETKSLEVHLWDGDATAGYKAFQQTCYVVPQSYGGDTSGYQIPYSVNYVGEKTEGTFVPDSAGGGTFTAAS
ncbi:MAG: hypothetical protein LIP12_00260 [Clostridiales bacterium]|nr:hypothetical protein [Clostridiales bacterium]